MDPFRAVLADPTPVAVEVTPTPAAHDVPSPEWRRRWSLLLGLERLLVQEEPTLVDGTVLSAHQVDALSGTLTALLADMGATPAPLPEARELPDTENLPAELAEEEVDEEPQDWADEPSDDQETQLPE